MDTDDEQPTVNVIVLVAVAPPVAVMVNIAVSVSFEVVGTVKVLPDDVKPDPEAT